MQAKQIILARHPQGTPQESDFSITDIQLPRAIRPGELLLESRYISVDPYLRGLMNATDQPGRGFSAGQPLAGAVVARVLKSEAGGFAEGDLVTGNLSWATHQVSDASRVQLLPEDKDLPESAWLGLLGMPGLTGYFGLTAVGRPRSGETIVISGAAGAVGGVVGQVAKIMGCRVIGLAGSDEKVKSLQDIGFDQVINYKSADVKTALAQACPQGIDIYFDNVGGPVSADIIGMLNMQGRAVICGQISTYNGDKAEQGPSLLPLILNHSATVQGFHVTTYQEKFAEAIAQLKAWYSEGKIRNRETVSAGFENLPAAFIGLFSGKNNGKMLVKI